MQKLDIENEIVREYFKILSDEFPEFLYDYMNTPEMQRLKGTSCACGTDHTKVFNNKFYYSNYEHSIGAALIVWNFTKNKRQTLAALFHDIATPAFKHCIDFMNGDSKTQESTEEETEDIIRNSNQIMRLLQRDGISVEEVKDYHIYPIADNDTPKLSADRLEYTLSNGIYFKEVWNLEKISEIYNNIEILENEEGIKELGFKNTEVVEDFIAKASKVWPRWICSEDKTVMQFWADVLKEMSNKKMICKQDLYNLSEYEIIYKIKNCGDKRIQDAYEKFENATKVYESDEKVEGKYCVSVESKRRYVIPLVKCKDGVKRINEISKNAKENIDNYLNYKTKKYAYFDFDF